MTNDLGLIHDATELRKLIMENPDLPIVVLAGEEANISGGYYWMYCSSVTCCVDEILDVTTPYGDDGKVFSDRTEFAEAVDNGLYVRDMDNISDEEFEAMAKAEIAKYDQYWRKVIAVYVTN